MQKRSPRTLILVGVAAGVAQVIAGVCMYLAGVYFAAWSMVVSLVVLLLCIVAGALWYRATAPGQPMTLMQAFGAGVVISVSTGVVYAIYNVISISYAYPHFLDDMARAQLAAEATRGQVADSFEALRAKLSIPMIAIPNLIRLSVLGSVLALVAALFTRREAQHRDRS